MLQFMVPGGDGRAVLAPWIIKLLAGSFLTGGITWATWVTVHMNANAQTVAVVNQRENDHYDVLHEQLNRIEHKLDQPRE